MGTIGRVSNVDLSVRQSHHDGADGTKLCRSIWHRKLIDRHRLLLTDKMKTFFVLEPMFV